MILHARRAVIVALRGVEVLHEVVPNVPLPHDCAGAVGDIWLNFDDTIWIQVARTGQGGVAPGSRGVGLALQFPSDQENVAIGKHLEVVMGQMRGAVVGILPDQIAVPVVFVQEPAGTGRVDITVAPLAMRRVVAQQVAVGQQVTDQSRDILRMPLVDDVSPFVHEICRGGRIRGKQHVPVLGAGVVEKQTSRLREH